MTEHKYMLRFFAGPTAVKQVADAVRAVDRRVVEGTEHIWIEWEGEDALAASENFRARLREQAGTDFGIELKEQRRIEPGEQF
jgi:hypothetical protein